MKQKFLWLVALRFQHLNRSQELALILWYDNFSGCYHQLLMKVGPWRLLGGLLEPSIEHDLAVLRNELLEYYNIFQYQEILPNCPGEVVKERMCEMEV